MSHSLVICVAFLRRVVDQLFFRSLLLYITHTNINQYHLSSTFFMELKAIDIVSVYVCLCLSVWVQSVDY